MLPLIVPDENCTSRELVSGQLKVDTGGGVGGELIFLKDTAEPFTEPV
jgi:hypothetical protein